MEQGLLQDFMSRAIAVDRQQASSGNLLSSFQRNLEQLRRLSPLKDSGVLKEIFNRNQTTRLTSYIESGCRHTATDKRIVLDLNESLRSLQHHVKKIHSCLEELEKVLDAATNSVLDSMEARTQCQQQPSHEQETCALQDYGREVMDKITNMALIHSMLQRDHEMQAKVADDLSLDMQLEALQSYHTMWTLRPFVNEKVMAAVLQG